MNIEIEFYFFLVGSTVFRVHFLSQPGSGGLFSRALDKREYLMIIRDNFCLFCIKTYVVTPHLNLLIETVQMRGHNIWF